MIPVVFVAIFTFSNARSSLSDSIEKNLETIAEFKVRQIEDFFSELKDDLTVAQGYYNIKINLPVLSRLRNKNADPNFINSKKQLDDQLFALQKTMGFEDIMLADTSGTIVYSSNPGHREEYARALDYYNPGTFAAGKDNVYFSDPYVNNAKFKNFKFGMIGAAPIRGFDKKWIGEVIFEINLDPIYGLIQSVEGLGNTGETLVGRRINNNEVLILNPLRYDATAALNKKIIIGSPLGMALQNAVAGNTGSGIVTDYRGVKVLAHWHDIRTKQIDWGIVSKIDIREALTPINNLKDVVFLVIIVEVLVLTGIILAISKSISDPIEQLRKGTEIIAAGNLVYKVATAAKDEVGELSRSFEKMLGQLNESQSRYIELIESTPMCVKVFDSKGNLIFLNKGAREEHFLKPDEDSSKWNWLDTIKEKYRPAVKEKFELALKGESGAVEFEHIREKSKNEWCSSVISPVKDKNGNVKSILVYSSDISELKLSELNLEQKVHKRTIDLQRLNRALMTISEANQTAIKAADEPKLLKDICDILVKNAGYRMVWVGYKEENEQKSVKVIAFAGYDEGYLDKVNVTWSDTERGRGPTGTAIREGRVVVFPDFEKEAAFKPWLQDALARGYKGSIVFPLFVNNKVLGAISIYTSAKDVFTSGEIKVLQELSSDLSYSIESIRNRAEKEKANIALLERTGELEKSEERYRSLIELSPDAIVVHSGKKIIFANVAAVKLLGARSLGEIIGKNTLDFVHPDSLDAVKQRITKMLTTKGNAPMLDEKFLRLDGGVINVEVIAATIVYQGERAIQVIIHDITERKKTENYLREINLDLQKFKMAVESSDNHIIITDPDGKIIYANKAAEIVTGYPRSEMIGQRPSLWGNQMDKKFYENMWRVIKGEKKTFSGEIDNKRKDGIKYAADVHISPVLDQNGDVKFFVGIERDITKEKQLDKAKSEFVSIASHQLRTPLTAIKWVSERFLKTEKLTGKGREYLQDINISMERLSIMVDDLLNISRIEENVVSVSPSRFDIIEFMNHTLSEWKPLFERKNISHEFSEHPDTLEVETDKNILGNILQSLISNAIEYTPAGGSVKAFIMKEQGDYLIAIKDNGIGIPKEEQSVIFKKFGRTGNAKLVKPDGTGLGLYIASQTTKLLGGKIWFESEEGKGTAFFVKLPFKSPAKPGKKSIV